MKRPSAITRGGLAALLAMSFATVACESDTLTPISGFQPEDCLDPDNCSEGGFRLDSGVKDDPDAGVATDASDLPDVGAGPVDSGVPDTGPADTGPDPTEFVNVGGYWNTQYDFDTSEYLLGIAGAASTLDIINQALNGNVDTGFPPLDLIIENILVPLIPQPVADIIDVLNDIANFSERMEATGTMLITQEPPLDQFATTVNLTATEEWNELTIYIIDQCPLGRNDPNYPQCARVPIPATGMLQQAGPLEVGVTVDPFSGTLANGVPQAALRFENREVEIQMAKLVGIMIDAIIRITSNGQYQTLEERFDAAFDCPGIGQQAYNWGINNGLGVVGAIALRQLAEDQCEDVIDDAVAAVFGIVVSDEIFDFDQIGLAKDLDGDGIADELQLISVPDTIDGRFSVGISADLGGAWEGVR